MSTSTDVNSGVDHPHRSEATTSADIPVETDDLVVVPALSSQLDEPIGTIVVKSVFDTTFPPRLKGVVDSDSFLVGILVRPEVEEGLWRLESKRPFSEKLKTARILTCLDVSCWISCVLDDDRGYQLVSRVEIVRRDGETLQDIRAQPNLAPFVLQVQRGPQATRDYQTVLCGQPTCLPILPRLHLYAGGVRDC